MRLAGLAVAGRPGIDVSAAVLPADRYAAGQRVDGLIGQDVLASVVYTIDYGQRAVRWHQPGDVLPGDRLPLQDPQQPAARQPRATRRRSRSDLHLVPDSGSDALVLFAHAQGKLRLTLQDVGVLSSVSGSRLVHRADVDRLVVGTARLRNPPALVIESDEPVEMMGDGLLPLHVFARVTFNVAEGYLIVHPR